MVQSPGPLPSPEPMPSPEQMRSPEAVQSPKPMLLSEMVQLPEPTQSPEPMPPPEPMRHCAGVARLKELSLGHPQYHGVEVAGRRGVALNRAGARGALEAVTRAGPVRVEQAR